MNWKNLLSCILAIIVLDIVLALSGLGYPLTLMAWFLVIFAVFRIFPIETRTTGEWIFSTIILLAIMIGGLELISFLFDALGITSNSSS